MEKLLLKLMRHVLPKVDEMTPYEQLGRMFDFLGIITGLPFTIIGLVWLVTTADVGVLWDNGLLVIFMLGAALLLTRYAFYVYIEVSPDRYADFFGALTTVVYKSALWMFGPAAIFIFLVTETLVRGYYLSKKRPFTLVRVLNDLRNWLISISAGTFFILVALEVYKAVGGSYPIDELSLDAALPAVVASVVMSLSVLLVWLPQIYLMLTLPLLNQPKGNTTGWWLVGQFIFNIALELVVALFAILAAGIYGEGGWQFYVFYIAGFSLVAYTGNLFSEVILRAHRRSRELEKLEQLGRAILDTPPNALNLPELLEKHVSRMFLDSQIEIRLLPSQVLLRTGGEDGWRTDEAGWAWLAQQERPHIVYRRMVLPWKATPTVAAKGLLLVPIMRHESNSVSGGVWIEADVHKRRTLRGMLPAAQSLADQVASALQNAQLYQRTLAHERLQQELSIAGRIQSSFLPREVPQLAGWDLAVRLDPARETSGDFYDLIPLTEGRWGLVVADVADKGTGAALFMALSRTLIRTYALQFSDAPEQVLAATNARILQETYSNLFVTVFYGIIDPVNGLLRYASAGHNPPYVTGKAQTQALRRTGIPLGMMENATWRSVSVELEPGSTLVLYTDGVTEAQNCDAALFGEDRLLRVVEAGVNHSAGEVEQAVIKAVHEFAGDAPQADDITVLVLVRHSQN